MAGIVGVRCAHPNLMQWTPPPYSTASQCAKRVDWQPANFQEVESKMNTNAAVIGLDIAKNVFVAVGLSERGKVVLKKRLSRPEVLGFFANVPKTAIGIEACAGAHYWARELNKLGHATKLIAAQHVKSFVLGNKNDARDAEAIAEIRARAQTKYVPINTVANQDLQMLHRARAGLMQERKALLSPLARLRARVRQGLPGGGGQVPPGLSHLA